MPKKENHYVVDFFGVELAFNNIMCAALMTYSVIAAYSFILDSPFLAFEICVVNAAWSYDARENIKLCVYAGLKVLCVWVITFWVVVVITGFMNNDGPYTIRHWYSSDGESESWGVGIFRN